MTELEDRLERFETLTAECELIAKLATDSTKREFYLKLAEHYYQLARETRAASRDQRCGLKAAAIRS
ncbi:hypothetical protein [Bradyrhizobium diazoefficiens]|uniref:hypothetical protein n=1 Tax=Bradyrhizobium diazoefficiens TaxID=1355477 RepID=UPI0002FDF851|nr:hypothetical protein [Bradyrhizobium diazoefficiens]AND94130.1 hypothetical protein AAV28_21130 [Bradyrhizobium diazoefficiens USDA 110]QBP27205.1 hypothetical protein Bdiaspc4_25005 [Bradyrhizobium diazoefficiens]